MGLTLRTFVSFILLASALLSQKFLGDVGDVRFKKTVDMTQAVWFKPPITTTNPSGNACLFERAVILYETNSTLWVCKNAVWTALSGAGGSSGAEIQAEGVAIATRAKYNFIEGPGFVISAADNPGSARVDIQMAPDTTIFPTIDSAQSGVISKCIGSGTAGAQTCTMPKALVGYAAHQVVQYIPGNTNTTTQTVNIDGLGVSSIIRDDGTALQAGDLTATRQYALTRDADGNFRLPAMRRVIPHPNANLCGDVSGGVDRLDFCPGVALVPSNNLTDLTNAATGRGSLGLTGSTDSIDQPFGPIAYQADSPTIGAALIRFRIFTAKVGMSASKFCFRGAANGSGQYFGAALYSTEAAAVPLTLLAGVTASQDVASANTIYYCLPFSSAVTLVHGQSYYLAIAATGTAAFKYSASEDFGMATDLLNTGRNSTNYRAFTNTQTVTGTTTFTWPPTITGTRSAEASHVRAGAFVLTAQ